MNIMINNVVEKFLRYAAVDTQSVSDMETNPSSEKQFDLANQLAEELRQMGAKDVRVDKHCYVYASIPANTQGRAVLGFIAHMDTVPGVSGAHVTPRIVRNYDGGDILLNEEKQIFLSPKDFDSLEQYVGQDLIVTDGTTLLGADDKAGVAEIMTMAETLLTHPEIPHGEIRIAFTPDEEVGCGVNNFDIAGFGADYAYTVDGGRLGELEYENFNAAGAKIRVHGKSVHTGSAKGKMKNALLVAMELHQMLPVFENPICTSGYEGFFHLDGMSGDVELARMEYIIRDHDQEKFQQKKERMTAICDYLNQKYGPGTVELELRDSYYNMKEKVLPHFHLIDNAKAAMEAVGVTPIVSPIRGGTDGCRLSYMGLPCPNLCTGGENFHGRYEYISIQSMEKVVELLVELVKRYAC